MCCWKFSFFKLFFAWVFNSGIYVCGVTLLKMITRRNTKHVLKQLCGTSTQKSFRLGCFAAAHPRFFCRDTTSHPNEVTPSPVEGSLTGDMVLTFLGQCTFCQLMDMLLLHVMTESYVSCEMSVPRISNVLYVRQYVCIAVTEFYNVWFLAGTASCQPSTTRGVSCMALKLFSETWLFDVGESSQVKDCPTPRKQEMWIVICWCRLICRISTALSRCKCRSPIYVLRKLLKFSSRTCMETTPLGCQVYGICIAVIDLSVIRHVLTLHITCPQHYRGTVYAGKCKRRNISIIGRQK